jgi:integrase
MGRSRHKVQPIERFPATPRKDGRFQKKINGRIYYFGRRGDRKEALREYERLKGRLYNSAAPCSIKKVVPSIGFVVNLFLTEKKIECKAGRITEGWYKDYVASLTRFANWIGSTRLAAEISIADMADYRRYLLDELKFAGNTFNRERSCILAMSRHAVDMEWIEAPLRFGRAFRRVPKGDIRVTKKAMLVCGRQIVKAIRKADPQLHAMILLGINCGFGPGDCAALTIDAIHGNRIRFARPKTHIRRDCILWSNTISAVRKAIRQRPHAKLIFQTNQGNRWSGTAIAHQFSNLCKRVGIELPEGVGMYALRHTFATYAREVRDIDAYRRIMGRKVGEGVDEDYIETVSAERLEAVVNHVRSRLFNKLNSGHRH